jgi:6-phosphogluconolactonase
MPEVQIYKDLDSVAEHVAEALVIKLAKLTSTKEKFHIVLTGGTLGIRTLQKVSSNPKLPSLNLDGVNFWWGDERFLPKKHPDRNAFQAKSALLDSLNLIPAQLHEFPEAGIGHDLDHAAAEFSKHFLNESPTFDLVLLGVGPDGHIASLFPGREDSYSQQSVVAEHSSPKPPAERLSFSYAVLNSADEVWFLAAGEEKKSAVSDVLGNGSTSSLPAAQVIGKKKTIWFVDEAAVN